VPDERRRYPRVPTHLNVLLLRAGLRPRGCRVLDISPGGLFLECAVARGPQHPDEPPPPENGEAVEVRLLVRDGETPEHFTLGGQVTHLTPSGLGVIFDQPQPALMGRLLRSEPAPASRHPAAAGPSPPQLPPREENAMPGRTAFYAVLAIAVLGLALALSQWLTTAGMRQELDNLETAYAALSTELKQLRGRQSELVALTGTLADMGRQMDSISTSVGELRSGTESPATPTPAPAAGVGTAPASTPAPAPVAVEPGPPGPVPAAGPWQVNLITLGNREDAAAFAERARAQGVPAEPMPVTRAGQTLWRVSVPGFPDAEAASVKARDYQERLDLEGAWVSRR